VARAEKKAEGGVDLNDGVGHTEIRIHLRRPTITHLLLVDPQNPVHVVSQLPSSLLLAKTHLLLNVEETACILFGCHFRLMGCVDGCFDSLCVYAS